jgi:single-stranded-DNA-specific exonuclease
MSLPIQRWNIAPPTEQEAAAIAQATGLPSILAQVLINRGATTQHQANLFLHPDRQPLSDPKQEFADLVASLDRLERAINQGEKIAICGDYDADGMTSTALLLRVFKQLGARAEYAIPSRMQEGYGINQRIVEELHAEGVSLVLTVDNGIAAYEAIAHAKELGLSVIITDHHDIPPQLPPADAILNPKLIDPQSPYYTIAGVGVAYLLGVELAHRFNQLDQLIAPCLELFALGTIADLAQLTGINRRLVKQGLKLLAQSKIPGIQALIDVSQIARDKATLKPEAIGFGLGPRINAVGRIGDPQVVIELLTTDDMGVAMARAMQCEQINQERRRLCSEIEKEAIAIVEASQIDLVDWRVLVLVKAGWHHGVIGIVASRLLERYGVPVFIGSEEEDGNIRFSVRGIPEFNVFDSLEYIKDIRGKGGGHPAAGGFTMPAENLPELKRRLREFARACLTPEQVKPLVSIDVEADLHEINLDLLDQIDALHPCGIGNAEPVFYTPNVQILSQQTRGKRRQVLALEIDRGDGAMIKAIAWRWGEYCPIPYCVDIAYKLKANHWQGNTTVELELVGIREPVSPDSNTTGTSNINSQQSKRSNRPVKAKRSDNSNKSDNDQLSLLNEQAGDRPSPNLAKFTDTAVTETNNPIATTNATSPENFADQTWSPVLEYKAAPAIATAPQWSDLTPDLDLNSLPEPVLLYGYQRPEPKFKASLNGSLDCDRPQRSRGKYGALVLWSLPPSVTHLKWLIALAQPQWVYLGNQIPAYPNEKELYQKAAYLIGEPKLNLLELAQAWWVAPSTIVAILRQLGYACNSFPDTTVPKTELAKLHNWYRLPIAKLAQVCID